MHPLAFSWPHALVFWLVYLWAFVPESQFIRRGGSGSDFSSSEASSVGTAGTFSVNTSPPTFGSGRTSPWSIAALTAGSDTRLIWRAS